MPDPDGVLRHIQHAEEWLRWARSDNRRGDVRAVVLRLLLAEAEIRHAREVGARLAAAPHASRRPRRRIAAVAAAVALLVAAGAVIALRPAGRDGSAAVGMSPHAWAIEPPAPAGAVRLEAGRLLTLGPALAGGEQDRPGGSPGGSEYRLVPIDGDGEASGDPGSSSAAF
jgi:hypothetical protein